MQGRLISFEGIDGVGKSTQLELLRDYLTARGHLVQSYREPGGTPAGEELRRLIKAGSFQSALAELLAFETARAELVMTCIRPALERGELVLLDRFADSSLAYQGALGMIAMETIRQLNAIATDSLQPDLTFWLDLEPAEAMQRRRNAKKPAAGGGAAEATELDSIESRDLAYFTRVRGVFQQLCNEEPLRFRRISALLPVDEIHSEIRAIVEHTIGKAHG